MVAGDVTIIQPVHNPKPAMVCDGTDDYAEIDAFTVARVAANDTVGTITGWINVNYTNANQCMFSSGDDNAVEHLNFGIEDGAIHAECKVATVMKWDIDSTDDNLVTGTGWHHIALVHNGTRPILYHNGVAVAMTDTTATDLTSWYDALTGGDVGAIGVLNMNSTLTLDSFGGISGVKYFNTALTATQIKDEFKGNGIIVATNPVDGATTGLISHWTMDSSNSSSDDDIGGHDGTLTNQAHLVTGYSQLSKEAKELYVAAGDDWTLTSNEGQLTLLHVEGV